MASIVDDTILVILPVVLIFESSDTCPKSTFSVINNLNMKALRDVRCKS